MERRFLRRLLLPTLLIMLCIQVFAAQEQSAAPALKTRSSATMWATPLT